MECPGYVGKWVVCPSAPPVDVKTIVQNAISVPGEIVIILLLAIFCILMGLFVVKLTS